MEVNENDINNKISLDIKYIEDKTDIEHYHDNLKELNELNTWFIYK